MPKTDRAVRHLDHNPHAVVWARKQADRTQAWVAEQVGISAGHLSEIEHGIRNARPALLRKIAAALGCPVADLAGGRTEVNTNGGQ